MASVVEQNLDLSFKSANIALKGIEVSMDVISNLLEYISSNDPTVKLLKKYMQADGELEFVACKKGYEKELYESLKDAGVNVIRTGSVAYGGTQLFVFPDFEREKVEAVLKEFRAEHGRSGIVDHQILNTYANGRVREIRNLDQYEATLCAEHAEKRGIKVVVSEPTKGLFTVSYAERDSEALNRIKADVAIELSGIAGRALQKQLKYENDKVISMLDMVKNYEKKESVYLVDLKGKSMEVDWEGVSVETEEGFLTFERNEPDFEENIESMIMDLNGPILLTKEQKEEFDHTTDRKVFLRDIDHANGRPRYSEEEIRALKEISMKRELYEMKLAMLEPDQAVHDICLENDDMRMATFEEFNDINEVEANSDIDEDLYDEMLNRFHFYRTNDKPSELDYEIVDYEESILDGKEIDEREYEDFEQDAFDLMHDKNNNLMPDEYEPGFGE